MTTEPAFWQLHGLVVRSDAVPLDARALGDDAVADVEFRIGADAMVPAVGEMPDGEILAHFDRDGTAELTVTTPRSATDAPSGQRPVDIHFHGLATVTVSDDRSLVEVHFMPGADRGLASVLLGGTVMSVLLHLRGHPVLHASAVTVNTSVGEVAIAFVGSSGMGKSTLATLSARDGARLLGDDVLRVDLTGEGPRAWPGATATRLRDGARALAEATGAPSVTTSDGRTALALPAASTAVPLLALVVPRPDRGSHVVEVERLSGLDAFMVLARFPRIVGWQDARIAAAAHEHNGALVNSVPMFRADIPWGPPFASGLGAEVIARVLDGALPTRIG